MITTKPEMIIPATAQQRLNSTCCHKVLLKKDNEFFTGIYNGLTSSGQIYNQYGNIVDSIYIEQDWDDENKEWYDVHISEIDFQNNGYTIIR